MARERAQERIRTRQLARLGALFAGFAHEIRNPLSTIGLNLALVKEDFADAETPREKRIHRRLSVVESEVRRLQGILDEFLGFVRVPTLRRAAVDLNVLLDEIAEFNAPDADGRGISLRVFADAAVGRVPLDADQFRAVMVNLLRNALDATPSGGQIMLATRREGSGIVVQVIDTGHGMSEDVLKRVFEPYFSTKKSGVGLGLPTARRIVEQHGGTIEVASEPGRGTQFTIRLPADGSPDDDEAGGGT